jgi:2-polyprenyl-3-methyl-5-hydroxy-6-metoxy-1,4-benzoquinol methylase
VHHPTRREQPASADTLCPACGTRSLHCAFELSRGCVASCATCGLEISSDDAETAAQDAQFHEYLDEKSYIGYFEPLRKGHYRTVLGRLQPRRGARLLDVGASFGWMLAVGAEFDLECYGIEPSPMSYEPELAGRVTGTTLEAYAAQSPERFDIVTLWHVLEHIRDPFAALRDVHKLLEPDGSAVIAVPNASGRLYRIGSLLARRFGRVRLMEELWYTHNPNMHRYYPTPLSLRHMLESASLRVVDSYTIDAFDWNTIWTRGGNEASRSALRLLGPLVAHTGITRAENLIVIAARA